MENTTALTMSVINTACVMMVIAYLVIRTRTNLDILEKTVRKKRHCHTDCFVWLFFYIRRDECHSGAYRGGQLTP